MLADDKLGEPKFSFFEAIQIEQAMKAADYISYPDFAHDAIIAKTDAILAREAHLKFPEQEQKVADEGGDAPTAPEQKAGTSYRKTTSKKKKP